MSSTMASNGELHLKYIKNELIAEIMTKLAGETLEDYEVEHSGGLDGFMSALYNINLKTSTTEGSKERLLIVKFMKGEVAFREASKSYTQFANEIYIYATVLPAYAKVLQEAQVTDVKVEDWVAPSYVAKYGYVAGLSHSAEEYESVLVLENLKPLGYTLGPRLYLTRQHLLSMCKPLGEYHALSYALRLRDAAQLERLRNGIAPLPFINDSNPNDAKENLYRVLYRVAFDRFFDFVERKIDSNVFDKQSADDLKLIERLHHMKAKYFEEPTRLLEHFRTQVEDSEQDRRFAVILHGDFNRNNVLFRYKQNAAGTAEGDVEVQDVKMIDFQELRFGSPALDVSFFMFFNTPESIRAGIWLDILREYHGHMYRTLASIVNSGEPSPEMKAELELYNFENFHAHFARYAFYGVLICLHFMPWILCSEQECAELSELFEIDMHGEAFRKISIEAGGDEVNLRILEVVRHACKMGYMDHF